MDRQEHRLVEGIIKTIVDYPEDVLVDIQDDERGSLITVKVNVKDMGRVIGSKGVTVEAIRTILKALGHKQSMSIGLKLLEPVE